MLEPTLLPTRDVESCTSWIRPIAWITLLGGLLAGGLVVYGGVKDNNAMTVGIGAGIAVHTALVCLLILVFVANSENVMAIARSQEIATRRLEDIRVAITAASPTSTPASR
jgi:Mg2+/Co2+ transporter CorB